MTVDLAAQRPASGHLFVFVVRDRTKLKCHIGIAPVSRFGTSDLDTDIPITGVAYTTRPPEPAKVRVEGDTRKGRPALHARASNTT